MRNKAGETRITADFGPPFSLSPHLHNLTNIHIAAEVRLVWKAQHRSHRWFLRIFVLAVANLESLSATVTGITFIKASSDTMGRTWAAILP
jgi:hypothetical protein